MPEEYVEVLNVFKARQHDVQHRGEDILYTHVICQK